MLPDGWNAGYGITLTNGVEFSRELTRDLSRRGLITAITNSVDGIAINLLAYNYDKLNRATGRNTDAFGYNARSEVTNATLNAIDYSYSYDNIGNHTASSVDSAATTYTANALNQYTSILCAPAPLREPSYDSDGNPTTNGVWSYAWDAENRLVAAYSNSVCIVSNAYDHASRRVAKWTPDYTTTLVYDGWNLVQETIQNQQSTITNQYVWGKDVSGTMQGAGGVGGLLAVEQGNAWYFPFYDANGNITAYINEQGSVVAEYAYDAFGGTIAQSGSMTAQFRFRFSTKYYDSETGFYYYGYRFYSPELHRWLNRDPIEEDGGLNLYAFCGNDGMNAVDAWGLWKLAVGKLADGVRRSTNKSREVYQLALGDTPEGLASIVGLDASEFGFWAKYEGCSQYSVPNVWIDADLLRGGGLYSRLVNLGGTIGSFFGTDMGRSSKRKIITVGTVQELTRAVSQNSGSLWGMTVYGHGNSTGLLSQQVLATKANSINQQYLFNLISGGGYRIAVLNMMQCYSADPSGTLGVDPITRKGCPYDWQVAGEKVAVVFNGYAGLNILGLDF